MLKTIKKLIIFITSWTILEIAATLTLFLFYEYDLYGLANSLTMQIVFYILLVTCALNGIILLISSLRLEKMKNVNNIKSEDIFGENIEESFEFSSLGIVVVDDSQTILWCNEIMNQVDPKLVDENILDKFPKLRDLYSNNISDNSVKVTYGSKSFDVSYLQSAGVYFFKDTTDYDNLYDYSKEQQMVLGIISFDNLSEFGGGEEEAETSDLIAAARTKILEYFKSYGVLLRRFKLDTYFAVCNYNSLIKLEENSFEILDTVRNIVNEDKTSITLSMGFAHDYPGPYKLNEKANDALEMAVSRGGDQVVVDKNGVDLKFYGGKTEAVEKKNKIQVRLYSNSLSNVIRASSNVLIMGHVNSDMDSVGSALGVKAICNALKVPSQIVYDLKLSEKKTKLAVSSLFSKDEYDDIFILPKNALNKINGKTLVVCVDFHRASLAMSKDVIDACSKIAIIDHHRRSEEFIDSPIFTYVDSSASSAGELVTELIQYSSVNPPIDIPSNYATLMLAGIFVDTNFYKSVSTGARTFEASMILRRFGADNIMADNFLKDDYEERALINKILTTIKTPYNGIVYCLSPDDLDVDPVILSKAANECISIKGVSASFVIGRTQPNEIKISARSDGSVNVQILCERIGIGGGHFALAASSIKDSNVADVETLLLETLKEHLEEARNNREN